MKKPKQYWIFRGEYPGDYDFGDFYSSVFDQEDMDLPLGNPYRVEKDHKNLTQVVEKSAYDKAIEALKRYTSESDDWSCENNTYGKPIWTIDPDIAEEVLEELGELDEQKEK